MRPNEGTAEILRVLGCTLGVVPLGVGALKLLLRGPVGGYRAT